MRNRKLARLEGNPPSRVNFSLCNILARLPRSRRDNRDFNIPRRGRQRERQKTIGSISKTITLYVHHAFLYISLPFFARLRRENA